MKTNFQSSPGLLFDSQAPASRNPFNFCCAPVAPFSLACRPSPPQASPQRPNVPCTRRYLAQTLQLDGAER